MTCAHCQHDATKHRMVDPVTDEVISNSGECNTPYIDVRECLETGCECSEYVSPVELSPEFLERLQDEIYEKRNQRWEELNNVRA